jgi:6-phosphogluconolactonase/glucosamine-6-phosphate isomerase/deaminase
MPTSVSTGAYIAALHKKLAQAERSLYEFRQIFNKLLDETIVDEDDLEPVGERARCSLKVPKVSSDGDGLYAGQLKPPDECED